MVIPFKKLTYQNVSGFLRAKYYSLFLEIGKRCKFGKQVTLYGNGIKTGDRVYILRFTELCGTKEDPIVIGNNVFINQRCIIRKNVTIGNNVSIGPNVSLMSDTHEIGDSSRRAGESKYPPINIGDGCWIGANSLILGGVTIGEGTIIAAGSVVNKDCEPNGVYAGVPAKRIKDLPIPETEKRVV
jgi:acetyltransferase-like isoleucine patch superfamily enzyme